MPAPKKIAAAAQTRWAKPVGYTSEIRIG